LKHPNGPFGTIFAYLTGWSWSSLCCCDCCFCCVWNHNNNDCKLESLRLYVY